MKSSYLDTLTAGTHSLEILWTDGSASTAFAIQQSESQKPDNDVKELNTNQNPANQNPANQNPQSVPQNNTEQTDSMKNESPKTKAKTIIFGIDSMVVLLGIRFCRCYILSKKKRKYFKVIVH